ncbi:PH and SEC7 domain-containing protein 3 [Aplysia californica]|uniref:PH and SEC7 domain-containing protein 3 n=1 Tax=Aplysia californica TaxID=6500 RepID=A0ABM0JSV4_APLCA|nr:PH and SEC7 domain-containing protein 3 [Aplysia californica]
MADRASQGLSRIPVPMKTPPPPEREHMREVYVRDVVDGPNNPPKQQQHQSVGDHNNENGSVCPNKTVHSPATPKKGKGFETYLMTGEMIIRTNTNPVVCEKTGADQKDDILSKTAKESQIPKLDHGDRKNTPHRTKVHKTQPSHSVITSPKISSKIPGPIKSPQQNHQTGSPRFPRPVRDGEMAATVNDSAGFPIIQAPVAEMEELSDLSQSSCSESEMGLGNDPASSSPKSLPTKNQAAEKLATPGPSSSASRLEEAVETLDMLQATLPGCQFEGLSDTSASFPEPLSSGDSGFVHDGHASDPDLPDRGTMASFEKCFSEREGFMSDETLTEREDASDSCSTNTCSSGQGTSHSQTIVASSSGEKFMLDGGDRPLVRTSKSHENYLQAVTGIAVVNIDIEDNLAYSLDTLTYHDSSDSSLDKVSQEPVQVSRSLHNSPEKKSEKATNGEREFMPGFISLEDSKQIKLKLNKQREEQMDTLDESSTEDNTKGEETNNSSNCYPNFQGSSINSQRHHSLNNESEDSFDESRSYDGMLVNARGESLQLSVLSDDSDAESLYHQPSKAVDRPSAERLAKRLYNLEGFRKSDVSRHLCKKNDFSNLVAEEYLKFFYFQDDTLDVALRKFLSQFSLFGETQERERVLAHFSQRFMECNPGSFNSEDACHTLTCAIMLLHSDLHSRNVRRRMTCQEFIENLSGLNDGENFPKEVLKAIYQAIKTGTIEWAVDEDMPEMDSQGQGQDQAVPPQSPGPQALGSNPFLEVPDPSKATEYKKGYVMRKCCMEPEKRKTPFGKRGWKMMYSVLRDMILYQYKDEHHFSKGQFVESSHNAIRIHHSLATKAADYAKKQHVFRLQTADWAEFLFQTGNPKELQEWVDTINLVAASLSAPPLPGAVGSRAKFQRPLLPSSFTKCNLREQLQNHELKVEELEQELRLHRVAIPEKGSKTSIIQDYLEKETYLEFEIKRFKTYVYLLQGKLSAYPELEPSLAETTIGEYEEMGAGPSHIPVNQVAGVKQGSAGKPVQRSLSDSDSDNSDTGGDESLAELPRAPVINTLSESTKM